MSVLGSVGDTGSHLETSQAPSCLLRWMDRVLPPPLLTRRQWWVAGAAVAAASARAWEAAPGAHHVLLSCADGANGSGGEVAGAASASVGTHSGRTTGHRSEC